MIIAGLCCKIEAVLPLMALVFPVIWSFIDVYGMAKIDLTFDYIVHNDVVKVLSSLSSSSSSSSS